MNQLRRTRSFAVSLALALALLTAGFSYATLAQGASRLLVLAPDTESCAPLKDKAAAIKQGESFAVDVQGLTADEPVILSLVFPDGRVYSPSVASVSGPKGLDAVLDQPVDPGYLVQANSGGDYAGFVQTTDKWPLGCYHVLAQGVNSQIQVGDYLVVESATSPMTLGGPLSLVAQVRSGQQTSGEQGVTVDLFGRRFLSGETVQLKLIQPNGTIVDLPQEVDASGTVVRPTPPTVSTVGSFQMSLTLGPTYPEGDYTFVATSGNGQSVSAPFTLRRLPVKPTGFGLLNIANPAVPAPITQGESIQLQGRLFTAGENVSISLIQANGARRPLAVVQANQLGEFTRDVTLGRQLPMGQHQLLALSASTEVTRAIQLNAGSPIVPPAAPATVSGTGSGSGPCSATCVTPVPCPQPTCQPTPVPCSQPCQPTPVPCPQPTCQPTPVPCPQPTCQPTPVPCPQPTCQPTPPCYTDIVTPCVPTPVPCPQPTCQPTPVPCPQPTCQPNPVPCQPTQPCDPVPVPGGKGSADEYHSTSNYSYVPVPADQLPELIPIVDPAPPVSPAPTPAF